MGPLLERDLEHWYRHGSSLDPDDIAVFVVGQQTHHDSQPDDTAVAEPMELDDFVLVVRKQTLDDVHVEHRMLGSYSYDILRVGLCVGVLLTLLPCFSLLSRLLLPLTGVIGFNLCRFGFGVVTFRGVAVLLLLVGRLPLLLGASLLLGLNLGRRFSGRLGCSCSGLLLFLSSRSRGITCIPGDLGTGGH